MKVREPKQNLDN